MVKERLASRGKLHVFEFDLKELFFFVCTYVVFVGNVHDLINDLVLSLLY
jgi:hypothetical protein